VQKWLLVFVLSIKISPVIKVLVFQGLSGGMGFPGVKGTKGAKVKRDKKHPQSSSFQKQKKKLNTNVCPPYVTLCQTLYISISTEDISLGAFNETA